MQHIHVGIPRALLYHEFGGLWIDFLRNMDASFTVSGETNRHILDRGTSLAIDESCLPLKVYLGHVETLLDKCSHIFVPRIVQYHCDFYLCAKFAGLPDIVRNTFGLSSEKLISPNVEGKLSAAKYKAVQTVCRPLGVSPLTGYFAFKNAMKSWQATKQAKMHSVNPNIGIIGHSYLIKDAFFCREIIGTLKTQGASIITPDDIPSKILYEEAKVFQSDIYWQLSAKIAGAASYFCNQPEINGIVMISSFGCGPDSLINDYLEHHVLKKSTKPYIIINIDEHTGSAGIITRIEAFWDLMNRRLKS